MFYLFFLGKGVLLTPSIGLWLLVGWLIRGNLPKYVYTPSCSSRSVGRHWRTHALGPCRGHVLKVYRRSWIFHLCNSQKHPKGKDSYTCVEDPGILDLCYLHRRWAQDLSQKIQLPYSCIPVQWHGIDSIHPSGIFWQCLVLQRTCLTRIEPSPCVWDCLGSHQHADFNILWPCPFALQTPSPKFHLSLLFSNRTSTICII